MINRIINSFFLIIFLQGCSYNYMGADKWVGRTLYVERWYLMPTYKRENIPRGSAFYGASAQKLKNRFEVKYYQKTEDGEDDILIPNNNMWTVKHNGKSFHEQDDENLFFYEKKSGSFIKEKAIPDIKIPIKRCDLDGWCELYESYDYSHKLNPTLYIRQSVLIKGAGYFNFPMT